MKRVLRSDAHQAALERDGYAVVDLLDPTQVIALARHYNVAHPEPVKGMYTATFDPDKARMQADHAHLCSLTRHRLAELMQDIKVVIAGFVVKGPDESSAMGLHQDMTLVDENEFQGINIWCPLVDLDGNNGALQVVPGSHRWLKSLRSPTVATLYNEQRVALMRHVQPVYLRAGQAIVFDQSLLHCSPINRSGVQRVVVNMFVTHRDARMLICHLDPKQADQGVEVFEVDETVMFDFAPFRTEITAHPETGRSLGKVAYAFPSITAGFLQKQFPDPAPGQVQPTPPPSMPANAAALPVAPALVSPQGWRARLRRLVGV